MLKPTLIHLDTVVTDELKEYLKEDEIKLPAHIRKLLKEDLKKRKRNAR